MDTQGAFPSIETIKTLSGCTNRNTLIKGIKTLEEYRIIKVVRSKEVFNMVNLYVFQSTKYWKPIPGWKEKLEKYKNRSQYQFKPHRSIKIEEYRSGRDDTRTNLSENSPNTITNIKDVLRQKMQEMGIPIPGEEVAIQDPSGHSVVVTEKHDPFPVITGNLREEHGITNDTAINEDLAVKKRWKNGEATPEPPFLKGEKADEKPFINGEKWTKENEGINLMDITKEDNGPGTASL
jgi:hypothetical protein